MLSVTKEIICNKKEYKYMYLWLWVAKYLNNLPSEIIKHICDYCLTTSTFTELASVYELGNICSLTINPTKDNIGDTVSIKFKPLGITHIIEDVNKNSLTIKVDSDKYIKTGMSLINGHNKKIGIVVSKDNNVITLNQPLYFPLKTGDIVLLELVLVNNLILTELKYYEFKNYKSYAAPSDLYVEYSSQSSKTKKLCFDFIKLI